MAKLGDKLKLGGKEFEVVEIQERPGEVILKVVRNWIARKALIVKEYQEDVGRVPAEIWDVAVQHVRGSERRG